MEFDFIVIGAGSAGCAAAAGLAQANIGSVCVLEAGPTDAAPQVKIPFGLLYTMGSRRDWNFKSTPQTHADNRVFKVNRGLMVGGSSSIKSMVWFRGRADDFDSWQQTGWRWADVEPHFIDIEKLIQRQQIATAHPLSVAFAKSFRANSIAPLGNRRAPEVYPGSSVSSNEEITRHVRARSGTAYHPVGTLALGGEDSPVTNTLQLRGVDGLWVADASVMPSITSANTNAPSMMIGHKAAKLILNDVKN